MSQRYEYHQEVTPLDRVADVANAAAADGWRLLSVATAMAQVKESVLTPTSGGVVQVAFLVFERPAKAKHANGKPMVAVARA